MKWQLHLGLTTALYLAAAIAVAGPLAAQSAEQTKRIVFATVTHAPFAEYDKGAPLAVADADLARLKRRGPTSEPFLRSLGDTPTDEVAYRALAEIVKDQDLSRYIL
jgi:hypothetical protein